jgi:hypothetical protein
MRSRPVPYSEFVQLVRRYPPQELIPVLAAASAALYEGGSYRPDGGNRIHPWLISTIAKESIAWGNNFRSGEVSQKTILSLIDASINLHEPIFDAPQDVRALESVSLRAIYEQWPYQQSVKAEMARVYSMLSGEYRDPRIKILTTGAPDELFGAPLKDYLGAAFLLTVGAQVNSGYFDLDWLYQPQFTSVLKHVDATAIRDVFLRHFSSSWSELKRNLQGGRPTSDNLRRYDFNYLAATPYIHLGENLYIAPQTQFVTQRLSMQSLFHAGIQRWNKTFADDLGYIFQLYVQAQLEQLNDLAQVYPERTYGRNELTVDSLLVSGNTTFLVEAKAGRPRLDARIDFTTYIESVGPPIEHAFSQLSATRDLVEGGLFADLPGGNVRGLLITAEPFYLMNSPLFRTPSMNIGMPVTILSIGELESLVALCLRQGSLEPLLSMTSHRLECGADVPSFINSRVTSEPLENPLQQRSFDAVVSIGRPAHVFKPPTLP